MLKLIEHTYGPHIYMKLQLDNGRIEEIDVFYRPDGVHYITSADHGRELDTTSEQRTKRENVRTEIIQAFNQLY